MAKHARSENAKIVRKLGDPASEKIGSRVFPLRGPPAPMPTVGTRRSTRVFVAKTAAMVASDADLAARVLRSGKRLVLSKPVGKKSGGDGDGADGDEWMRLFGGTGDAEDLQWWKGEKEGCREAKNSRHKPPETDGGPADEEPPKSFPKVSVISPLCDKAFGIVYSRKRRWSQSDGSASSSSQSGDKETQDRRYGIAFVRRPRRKKPKVAPLVEIISRRPEIPDRELGITDYAGKFAEKLGILERKMWFGSTGRVVVVVLVESLIGGSLYRCPCILLSLLTAMRKKGVRLFDFAAFLLSRSIASVFSLHGIHFLPVRHSNSDISYRNIAPDAGICVIYGARLFFPLVSLNFAALPLYFKSLHLSMFLGSLYLPGVFARYQKQLCEAKSMDANFEEDGPHDLHVLSESGVSGMEIILFESPAFRRSEVASVSKVVLVNEMAAAAGSPGLSSRSVATTYGGRFRKHQRKRSSLRSTRVPNSRLLKSHRNSLLNVPNGILKVSTAAKIRPLNLQEKPLDTCLSDIFSGREKRALSSPRSCNQKRRKSARRNHVERPEDLKLALDEVKQDIDRAHCKANILVIESDRCWREEGAEVMLESSGPNEWCLAVWAQGTTRYLHKPHEKNPSVVNRYNHAVMWIGEDGWKLEFCDKKEWLVFKELRRVCCERNLQDVSIRIIPVPGVREVSGYEECFTTPFFRPESYIRMVNDEVERTLIGETAGYDMDSGDEEWLQRLNLGSLNGDDDASNHLSEANFEKIIFAFEKAAYSHPDEVADSDKATNLCLDLGKSVTVASVFDYWMKKRKQRRLALMKVFQAQPPRRPQVSQKPYLRKKRSFKRQGSHAGRGKPESFLEALATQEAVRRVQEAEAAANRAVEVAVQKRSRAQLLMANADLAIYKSVVALRLADAIRESGGPEPALDLASSILG